MAIVVNTNTSALTAQNSLNKAQSSMATALERMSTGYKINKAADDAAGLSIATSINTQIRGSEIAQSNIQQGINVLQTAEGAIGSIIDNVDRIRELAIQAANGINSSASRSAIKAEVQARLTEIDKTASATEFNGVKLLNDDTTIRLQVGANSNTFENSITVEGVFQNTHTSTAGLNIAMGTNLDTAAAAATYLDALDTALATLTSQKADIGAYQNRLNSTDDNLNTTITNMSAAKSTLMDADIATESSNYTKQSILQQASAALLSQANQIPSIALTLV